MKFVKSISVYDSEGQYAGRLESFESDTEIFHIPLFFPVKGAEFLASELRAIADKIRLLTHCGSPPIHPSQAERQAPTLC